MRVSKMKKLAKSRYKITMDNGSDIILFEEVIIKNIILSGKNIDDEMYKKIMDDNYRVEPYYQALQFINTRMRSKEEVRLHLKKKNYDEKLIDDTLLRLESEGHIDDIAFAKAYVNDKLTLSNDGVNKIKKTLSNFDIDENVIEQAVEHVDIEEMNNRLDKLISRQLRLNTKYTGNMLKNKIYNYLINIGYDSAMILEKLNNQEFKNSCDIEKEYSKLHKKYAKKYSGYKLDMTIKQHLYQKGYEQTDIERVTK